MRKLVLATKNAGKIVEFKRLLAEHAKDIVVLGLNDFPDMPDVVESGKSLSENARLKAKAISDFTQLPALADEVARWRHVSLHTNPEDPLLATRSRAAWDTHNLRSRIVNAAVLRANQNRLAEGSPPLQRVTPHGLRRTAASLWAAIGWNPSQMMRAMGHTQANLTLSVYAVAADYGENQREGLRAVARVKEGVGM